MGHVGGWDGGDERKERAMKCSHGVHSDCKDMYVATVLV